MTKENYLTFWWKNMERPKRTKQVIIINHRLGMSVGKIAAQAAHASQMSVLHMTKPELNCYNKDSDEVIRLCKVKAAQKILYWKCPEVMTRWTKSGYSKIITRGENEEELISAYTRAKDAGIPCYLVLDEARTELNGKHYTAVAIGPWYADDIDKITGDFKLL